MNKAYLLRETDSEDGRGFKDVGIAISKEDAIEWKDSIQEISLHFRKFIEYSIYQPERSKREDIYFDKELVDYMTEKSKLMKNLSNK